MEFIDIIEYYIDPYNIDELDQSIDRYYFRDRSILYIYIYIYPYNINELDQSINY